MMQFNDLTIDELKAMIKETVMEAIEESLLMQLFLDVTTTEALKNYTLQLYTTEMSEAAHKLISDVQITDS